MNASLRPSEEIAGGFSVAKTTRKAATLTARSSVRLRADLTASTRARRGNECRKLQATAATVHAFRTPGGFTARRVDAPAPSVASRAIHSSCTSTSSMLAPAVVDPSQGTRESTAPGTLAPAASALRGVERSDDRMAVTRPGVVVASNGFISRRPSHRARYRTRRYPRGHPLPCLRSARVPCTGASRR